MHRPPSLFTLGLPALLIAPFALAAAVTPDWPQWRGPAGDGLSQETGWKNEGKDEPRWEMNVGMGYSTVSIKDGLLYTQGHNEEYQEDAIYCLEAETGDEIWVHPFPSKTHKLAHTGGSLSTPSVDGDLLFALAREGAFFCFDAKTGEVLWEKRLEEEHEVLPYPRWMFSASPYVLEEMVVLNVGRVLAFDKKGELLWQSEENYGDAYSTPQEFQCEGRSCLAVFNGNGLAILERKTGKEVIFHPWEIQNHVNAATPVIVDGRVFISCGLDKGAAMVGVKDGKAEIAWESKAMQSAMSGCTLFNDHLYGFDGRTLKCLTKDGEEKWAQEGLGLGVHLVSDNRLILLSGQGELVIAEATPEAYRELSRKKVLDGGEYWTTPVIVNGLIYCRNSLGDMVCLDHRGE